MGERETHDVVIDEAGFLQEATRYTCRSPGCVDDTLVRQPYMTNSVWDEKVKEFRARHPFDKARRV